MKKGLIVFAREPLPGSVKTRLAASIGNHAAVELYETMVQDVLKTARQLCDVETIVFWDCEKESLPVLSEKYSCNSRCQIAGNLGQRMQAAFAEMFADGCDLCCIIGSDAPDLPLPYILEAYRLLEAPHTDVVLGPSKDGGYYLLGLRHVWEQLFVNIPWSTSAVCERTLTATRDSALTAVLLPEWQDIDTLEDLQAFQGRSRVTVSMEAI